MQIYAIMIKKTCFFLLAVLISNLGISRTENSIKFLKIDLDDDASFYMTATCDGGLATITGNIGGVFAFNPIPEDGAAINPITGTVTLGVGGATYTVEYTTAGSNPDVSTQNVTVHPSPNINAPTPLITCNLDGAEDGFAMFNLTEKDSEILNGLDPVVFTISYYQTQADAEMGVNVIMPMAYFNVSPYFQTIYVRVEDQSTSCTAFTTLDLIVENCTSGCEEIRTICYGNNNTTEYTYTSADGSPMVLTFIAGQMDVCCDWILIFDSDGTLIYEGNNNGNLTGLIVMATGDTITIQIQSNDSGSCETDNYIPIQFSMNCTESYGAITINSFFDENNNTVFDASENLYNAGTFTYEVNNNGVIHYVGSSNGSFSIPNSNSSNSYDIGFILFDSYEDCLNSTFTLIQDVVPIEGETIQINFPLTQTTTCNDIAVSLISFTPPRPGVLYSNKMIVENFGNVTVSGSVEFTHDALITLNSVLALEAGNTVTNTTTGFILNFNNLQPGTREAVYVILNVPTDLNLGDLLTNTVVYAESDLNLENNNSSLTEEVVNSYDPNNKIESHGPKIKLDDFTGEDYLFYTINFQNLGTADAIQIRVEDVLDSQLDASSFKMLNASHAYVVTRIDNSLTWNFDDINLPSESMDEPNSHGYVYFKIKPLSGYSEGDIISNTADIYFDFNPAITTNTFETEFVTTLSVNEFYTVQYSMYPNPANNTVYVQFNKIVTETLVVSIYNVQGKLVRKTNSITNNNKVSINVSTLSQGMYFIELQGESFIMKEKLIIK